jgi:hypothetical protein
MTPSSQLCTSPTSSDAARHIHTSGAAQRQRDLCLAVLRESPGLTAQEIEAQIGIKAHKRLPELRFLGLARNGPVRPCTVSGRQAMTWLAGYTNN